MHPFGRSLTGRLRGDGWGQTTGKGPQTLCFHVPEDSHASFGPPLHTGGSWRLIGFSSSVALTAFDYKHNKVAWNWISGFNTDTPTQSDVVS